MLKERVLKSLMNVAKEAGLYLMESQKKLNLIEAQEKTPNQWVSEVDVNAERLIVDFLKQAYPEAGFITEESTVENKAKELHFIIDPLDGTTNFLHGLDLYSVSIAAVYHNSLIAGVIYVPSRNEMFSAMLNGGAFLNEQPIKVSKSSSLRNSLIATGFPYYNFKGKKEYIACLDYYMQNTRGLRRMGSAAIDLAYVACGRFCGFFEMHLHPWDVAAGILLVEEAGGKVSDFKSNSRDWSGREIVATNKGIYSEFQKVLISEFSNQDI
jgi:myo-inositol-1(or 4)-monophosphatase